MVVVCTTRWPRVRVAVMGSCASGRRPQQAQARGKEKRLPETWTSIVSGPAEGVLERSLAPRSSPLSRFAQLFQGGRQPIRPVYRATLAQVEVATPPHRAII